MDEELALEHALFPWLDQPTYDEWDAVGPMDENGVDYRDPPYYCDCGCGLWGQEAECPDCGLAFVGGE
jgi:hypothetical protein